MSERSSPKWLILLIGLVVLVIGGEIVFFLFGEDNPDISGNPDSPKSETELLVEAVSKHILLPGNEFPTVATVTDPELLPEELFFANAKTGNKVLIYQSAKKAILYDPDRDLIIEVMVVEIAREAENSLLPAEIFPPPP